MRACHLWRACERWGAGSEQRWMDDKRTFFRCPNEVAWSLLSGSCNDCEVMNGMENFTYLTKDSQSGTYLATVTYFLLLHISRHVSCMKKRKKEEVLLSPPSLQSLPPYYNVCTEIGPVDHLPTYPPIPSFHHSIFSPSHHRTEDKVKQSTYPHTYLTYIHTVPSEFKISAFHIPIAFLLPRYVIVV